MAEQETPLQELYGEVQELKARFSRLLETARVRGVITHSEYIWIRDGVRRPLSG